MIGRMPSKCLRNSLCNYMPRHMAMGRTKVGVGRGWGGVPRAGFSGGAKWLMASIFFLGGGDIS